MSAGLSPPLQRALEAFGAARAADVHMALDGDRIRLTTKTTPLPRDIVGELKALRPEIGRILEWRAAANAAWKAEMPRDCTPPRWEAARNGLYRFVQDGWGDRAALIGWTKGELYRVPELWARIDQTGFALLIDSPLWRVRTVNSPPHADPNAVNKVIAVTETEITVEAPYTGSELVFRKKPEGGDGHGS
jgi:hypothetical protein